MELLYLYLGNINRPLREQGIQFDQNYDVNYNRTSRKLTVTTRQDTRPCIYGDPIENLNLLVGQNGTGKSTILEILGLPHQNRLELLPLQEIRDHQVEGERYTWFALYHIRDDLFAIEGYWPRLLEIFDNFDNIDAYWQPFYTAAVRFDLKNGNVASTPQYLQEIADGKDAERLAIDRLFYVLYEPEQGTSWYSQPYSTPKSDATGGFTSQRIYASHMGYEGITKYLYDSIHNHQFASKMASKPGTEITLQLYQTDKADFMQFADEPMEQFSTPSEQGRKVAGKLLYGAGIQLADSGSSSLWPTNFAPANASFSYQQRMVLIYLEELACYSIMQRRTWTETRGVENTYYRRKEYLLTLLNTFNQRDYQLAKKIVAGIEKIPERYFVHGTKAVIPVQSMWDGNFLEVLAQGLDQNAYEGHEINHRYFVRLSFTGISTGEAQYLDLYATLYHAIKTSRHRKDDTCVLLLDEPDCRFHPEWSRNFILNLTELLRTDVFKDYRYQVIISTHSPILVSDVPKEFIHCLYREQEGQISIRRSSFGLMSNLNDLLTDTFFAASIFGAYAEHYTNTLICKIHAVEQESAGLPRQQIQAKVKDLRERLDRIEDDVIRKSLEAKLRRLEERRRIQYDSDLH